VTAIVDRPKPEICFLPGRLMRKLFAQRGYGDSLTGRGSTTQPSNWEADTLSLNYRWPKYRLTVIMRTII